MAIHELKIVSIMGGCDVLDPESHSNRTTAKHKEKVRWENTLKKTVTLTFREGWPFEEEEEEIEIPEEKHSKHYTVRKIPGQTETKEYPYDSSCRGPIAGPVIVVPPPPPGSGGS